MTKYFCLLFDFSAVNDSRTKLLHNSASPNHQPPTKSTASKQAPYFHVPSNTYRSKPNMPVAGSGSHHGDMINANGDFLLHLSESPWSREFHRGVPCASRTLEVTVIRRHVGENMPLIAANMQATFSCMIPPTLFHIVPAYINKDYIRQTC